MRTSRAPWTEASFLADASAHSTDVLGAIMSLVVIVASMFEQPRRGTGSA